MSSASALDSRRHPTVAAIESTIAEGYILHIRAPRLPGKRNPRRDPMPAADFTVGPGARRGFLLVDYAQIKSGEECPHRTAAEAARAARKLLGWDRLGAAQAALRAVHGEPERAPSLAVELSRGVATGERMRKAFGHKPGIAGPLFGPGGQGTKPSAGSRGRR